MAPQTLFDLLGLDRSATVEMVESAFAGLLAAHDGQLAAIDGDVRSAYEILRVSDNLIYYTELLRACDADIAVEIPPEGRTTFESFCRLCGIRWFERPAYPNSFQVRHSGQSVPAWVAYDAEQMPNLRMSRRERLARLFRKFVLGEVFQGRSRGKRLWVAAAYVLVFVLGLSLFRSIPTRRRGTIIQSRL